MSKSISPDSRNPIKPASTEKKTKNSFKEAKAENASNLSEVDMNELNELNKSMNKLKLPSTLDFEKSIEAMDVIPEDAKNLEKPSDPKYSDKDNE